MYIYICICTCIHAYIHTYMHICMCVYVYVPSHIYTECVYSTWCSEHALRTSASSAPGAWGARRTWRTPSPRRRLPRRQPPVDCGPSNSQNHMAVEYVHIYIYMHVYVHKNMCVHMYVYIYIYVGAYTYTHVYVYTYVHMSVFVCMDCMYAYVYMPICVGIVFQWLCCCVLWFRLVWAPL